MAPILTISAVVGRLMSYDDDDDSEYVEQGVDAFLIVVGVVLFFFPEPFTSMMGILLMLVGALMWLYDFFA